MRDNAFLVGTVFFIFYNRSERNKDVCEIMLVKKDGKRKDIVRWKDFLQVQC